MKRWSHGASLPLLAATALAFGVLVDSAPAQAGFWDIFGGRGASAPAPAARPEKQRIARRSATTPEPEARASLKKPDAPRLLPASASGPITIVVSTDRQHLTVYDGDRAVADTVISTGVQGHSTPHGVFSVIEKQVFHRSSIYSGAPMPYMQRLTWSGIAMHEGHVTGRPASHGCVRLPAAFAKELFRFTRRGARVVIAREDVKPSSVAQVAQFAPPAARRFVMGEQADAGRMNGEIAMPDHTVGAFRPRTQVDAVGAAPITALVNRRTGMMYVRRAFAPIYEVPVTIDQPNQPIGAHVYVARKTDEQRLAWTTVSIAGAVREAHNTTGATKSDERPTLALPSSASEALKRVHLPPGAEQRLNQLLSQGATLIISDEDGRLRESQAGTNFIAIVN